MANNYKGVIIAESLEDSAVLKKLKVVSTNVEKTTKEDKTPWIKQWTFHKVEIPEDKADEIAKDISKALDSKHSSSWYTDFKNDKFHYIIFRNKIFKVDRSKKEQYTKVKEYGKKIGIPESQLDFAPNIKQGALQYTSTERNWETDIQRLKSHMRRK